MRCLFLPGQMDTRDLRVTQIANFSSLTHTKKLLLVTFCDVAVEICDMTGRTEGWTEVKVEIVM